MTRFITALAALLAASSAAAQGTTVTANQGAPSSAVYRGWKTQGNDQAGQAPSGMPVLGAGSDGSAVRTIKTDASGNQTVVGPTAAGAAPATSPVLTAGSDGSLIRTTRTDINGNPTVVGPTGSGLAPTTNPILTAGSDGSVITMFRTDTSGRPMVVGPAAAGATVAGNPVLMGGSDSANVQAIRTTTGGVLLVDPQVSGSTAGTATNPLVVTNRPGYVKTGAPSATVAISTVSAAATGLTASACYRVACNTPCFYRSGAATPTALTSDNPIFGPAVEKICIPSTDTALAFVTASGTGSCGLALLSNTP